jgi:hypothetical protein
MGFCKLPGASQAQFSPSRQLAIHLSANKYNCWIWRFYEDYHFLKNIKIQNAEQQKRRL